MQVFDKISDLRACVNDWRQDGLRTGFVPTMGALHAGHLSLVERARSENQRVSVSIFVNPTQFNNPDDLKNYPRTLEKDLELLKPLKPDVVFVPDSAEMYPEGKENAPVVKVNLNGLDQVLEGLHRPGHFKGVMQVVARLFDIHQPDRAYFGEKDYQQLAVIRKMTSELKLPIEIIGCPTTREKDGLAMSSRNQLLTSEYRQAAVAISKALFFARDNWRNYTVTDIRNHTIRLIEKSQLLKVEYVEIASSKSLEVVSEWKEQTSLRIFAAVMAGQVRLIDNVGINTAED